VAVAPLAERMPIRARAAEMGPLGDALHAFLAADPGGDPVPRRAAAERILAAHGVAGSADPALLVRAADALRARLEARFPGAAWRREWPVVAKLRDGGHPRLLRGEVDLFLELPGGFALVDHKSFPGSEAERDARVRAHAVQLAWYARALAAALEKPLRAAFVHLPIRGELVEVDLEPLLAAREIP
jgi:ATP-dependent exoDNAse (exonuclease V) beta subunit